MDLRQLQFLAALAREKHFTRAAAACNISQPTLSAAIRQLEEELGVTIVERGHRFVGFTAEGLSVLEHARRILVDCDALVQDLDAMRGGMTGRLRIGVIPTALPVVSHLAHAFRARHPAVTIAVLSMTSSEIQRRIDDFEIEAGITYLDFEPIERVRKAPLYVEEYRLLTPLGGPLGGRAGPVGWAEAADLPLVLLTGDMQNRRIVDAYFRAAGRTPRVEVETNAISNLWSHAAGGVWSSIVPVPVVSTFGPPPGCAVLALTDPHGSQRVGVIVSDRSPAVPMANRLFEIAAGLDLSGLVGGVPA